MGLHPDAPVLPSRDRRLRSRPLVPSPDVTCTRCGQTRAGFERPPFPGPIGARIVAGICQDCWSQWLRQQTMLINHYGLNVMDPQARSFLRKNMEAFLF